jgi:hypothetical protein
MSAAQPSQPGLGAIAETKKSMGKSLQQKCANGQTHAENTTPRRCNLCIGRKTPLRRTTARAWQGGLDPPYRPLLRSIVDRPMGSFEKARSLETLCGNTEVAMLVTIFVLVARGMESVTDLVA